MPNIAALLKTEISRVARKELRPAIDAWKKQSAAQRSEIASLKRRVQDLERQLKAVSRASRQASASPAHSERPDAEEPGTGLRFRAGGMASNRKRLGLSAAQFGRLIGATGQSVYAWEQGKSRPQARYLAAIAALRKIGKR
jgi:DNA-binding transcriptional regulator YiaG